MKILHLLLVLGVVSCLQPRPKYKPRVGDRVEGPTDTKDPQEPGSSDTPRPEKPSSPKPGSKPSDHKPPKPLDPAPKPEAPLPRKEFQNPVMTSGADPWVVEHEGWFYHCYSDGNASIYIRRTRSLNDIEKAESKRIWEAPPGRPYSKETWAPEVHFLQGKWYVYFAADDGKDANHKMFVLESETSDAMGNYSLKSQIHTDFWAIDGTVFKGEGNKLFFVWSGWPTALSQQQNIYIAPMKNPWTLEDRSAFRQRIEAEDGQLKKVSADFREGASNGKILGKIDFPESSVTFTVNAPAAGAYAVEISAAVGFEGGAHHLISANGGKKEKIHYPTMGWDNRTVVTAKLVLKAGENKVTLQKGDGYAELDFIVVKHYGKDPVLLTVPSYEWERRGGPPFINEGPQILRKNKKIMMIYSASGSWTNDYCLGQINLLGTDPMNSQAWEKLRDPVFTRANEVFGPGHASFVKTVDGKEDWIVYHAAKRKDSGWDRNVRIQRFNWKSDDSPDFGTPKPLSEKLSFPYKD